MKNYIIKYAVLYLLGTFLLSACEPKEINDFELDKVNLITSEQVSFSETVSPKSANVIDFTNTSEVTNKEYVITWDLGNGTKKTGKVESITGEYPYAGVYTVTMTLSNNYSSASVSRVLTIKNDDTGLLDTPGFRNLTGGPDNTKGKTWVFDQYKPGHMGVGPIDPNVGDIMSPSWWSAPANAKDGSSLYTQEFTFFQNGTKLVWKNNGYIYTNKEGLDMLGNPAGFVDNPGGVGDFDVPYKPKDSYTFSFDENAMTLTLSDDAFFGHYAGVSNYTIVSLTENELYIRCDSKAKVGDRWWYRLVPKDKNVPPPVVVKAVPLTENFEASPLKLTFVGEDMGDKSGVVDNPFPLPINESGKVYRYQKTNAFYTNLAWVAPDYKFDLTTQHKIRLKVFIPSYNNYTTENTVAGDWIIEKRLRPQVAIKLQNNELGGNAWSTQSEIIKSDLGLDKWLELEFDFSGVKDRKDFDKIVIQFGSEGQSGAGFFFFDDFVFNNK